MSKLKKKALELLTSAYFFFELLSAFRRTGLVGERRNSLVVYVTGTSRLLAKPLCLFIKGPSSVGKNFLADTVLGFFPSAEVKQLTSASTRAWNYQGTQLEHKTVYIKERNEAAGPVDPMRLLISENQLIHSVTTKKHGRFVVERRVTKGPVAAITTTTKDRVQVDDETRHISIWLDETPEQTTRIMVAAVDKQNGLELTERKVWHEVQRLIKKRFVVLVEFPDWFKKLVPCVRSDNLWARRYFPAFLQACRTVALIRSFRQKPRLAQKAKKITVRFTDFAVTALIFNAVLDYSIAKADEQHLEIQRHVRRISSRKGGNGVRATDLAEEMGISADRAYNLLRKAVTARSIVRANKPSKANLKFYLPAKPPRPFLPEPAEVFQKLEGLPERVRFVHPLTGEWVTYSRHGRKTK
jgi:hypothetical protein